MGKKKLRCLEKERSDPSAEFSAKVLQRLQSVAAQEEARLGLISELVRNPPAVDSAEPAPRGAFDGDAQLAREVQGLMDEEAALKAKVEDLQAAHKELDSVQTRIEEVHNRTLRDELADMEQLESIRANQMHKHRLLLELGSTNALNMCFHIWHEGPFATINGLRLGCLADAPQVDWVELNTAWGTAALLLDAITRDAEFESPTWRVVPRGTLSHMSKVKSGRVAPLYWTGGLWYTSFNEGMDAFAQCVCELGQVAVQQDPSMLLPHRIEPGTAGGLSLRFSESAEWTRAMKFLLTDLKWLVAWRSKLARKQAQGVFTAA